MVTVRFYGPLKSFGEKFELDVKNTAEALKALFSQLPQLRQAIQRGFYKIRIGLQYVDNRYLERGLYYRLKAGMTIHITPVVAGAKKSGVFQVIVGVALIGTALMLGPGGIALLSSASALMVGGIGASMLLGGVSQLLTKMPSMHAPGQGNEKKQSSAFGNIQNMAAQGQPIPLAYGHIRCGSMIISQGVETFDAETEQAKPVKKAGFRKG